MNLLYWAGNAFCERKGPLTSRVRGLRSLNSICADRQVRLSEVRCIADLTLETGQPSTGDQY
jgi:hypothetical protein